MGARWFMKRVPAVLVLAALAPAASAQTLHPIPTGEPSRLNVTAGWDSLRAYTNTYWAYFTASRAAAIATDVAGMRSDVLLVREWQQDLGQKVTNIELLVSIQTVAIVGAVGWGVWGASRRPRGVGDVGERGE